MTSADGDTDTSLATLPVTIYIGLVAILGIVGNFVVMVVYNRKYPTCNFKYFVLVLAGLDLVSCAILMPMEIYTLINWFHFTYSWLCKIKSFLNVFTVTSSASTLLLIAIDRFRKVCKPHSKQIQPPLAVKLTVLALLLSTIPATSDAVFWGIHTHVEGKSTMHMCEKDDEFKDTIWPQLHVAILYAGANSIVMLSTFVLYILIAVRLFCVSSGPVINTPRITLHSPVTGDKSSGAEPLNAENNDHGNSPNISDIESGLSESEDFIDANTIDLSDSQGNSTDDNLDDPSETVEDKSDRDHLEMVKLRPKPEQSTDSTPKKTLRISLQRLSDSCDRNSLQIPDLNQRKIPKIPASPTMEQFKKQAAYRRRRSTIGSLSKHSGTRLRRKTLIMFILTAVFIGTTVLYFFLIGLMADNNSHFVKLTTSEKTAWLFFLRLYFINSVINPILYGFLDPRFRRALWNMGIRLSFAAGSLKRNIGMSMKSGSSTSRNEVTVGQTSRVPRPILKSGSSVTVSE